jgi:hypothetical protein
MRSMKLYNFSISIFFLGIFSLVSPLAMALPPASDLPEEYLRAQIILEARSPLDGEVMAAGEYADLMAKLEKEITDQEDRVVVNKYREAAFLLRLRRLLIYFGVQINAR